VLIRRIQQVTLCFFPIKVVLIAESNLKMDAGDRFELPMHLAYETGVVTTLPA